MIRSYYLFLFIWIFFANAYSQYELKTDSLKLKVENNAQGSKRLKACEDLIEFYIEQEDSVAVMKYVNKGLSLAEAIPDQQAKYRITAKKAYLLFRREHYTEAIEIYNEVLAQSKKRGWNALKGDCLNILGVIKYNQSQYDEALAMLKEALNLRKSMGDKKRIGRSLVNVGRVYFYKGAHQKALEFFEKGLETSKEVNDTKNIINAYNNKGIIYGTLRDLQNASINFHLGLDVAELSQDLDGLSQSYANLGVLYKIKRDYEKAIEYHLKSITIFKRQKDRLGMAIRMGSLADIYAKQGNDAKSLEMYDNANRFLVKLGHKQYLANNYATIGGIYRQSGNFFKAKYYFRKAALIAEEIEAKETIAVNYGNIGNLFLEQNQEDSAFFYLKKSFRIYEEGDNTNLLISKYREVGDIYANKANLPKAINFYKKALAKVEGSADTLASSDIYAALGGLYVQQGTYNLALSNFRNARKGFENLDVSSRVADMNLNIADVFYSQKQFKEALSYGGKALKTYRRNKDSCSFGSAYLTIARSHISLKNTDSSSFYLNKALSRALQCNNVQSTLLSSVYGELGAFYKAHNQPDSSFVAYEKALKFASLTNNRLVMKNAAAALYPIYEENGQLEKAYDALKIYTLNRDALYNDENTRALVQQEYERELQQQAIIQQKKEAELAKQKWLTATFIGVCLAFILIGIVAYRNYRNKNKANRLLRAKNIEISEQRARLEVLDHTKSRFFANISHELRTPLTLISSPLENLIKNSKEQFLPSTKDILRLMYRNTQALKILVNDILDLSKLESDKMELQEIEVPIKGLLGRIAANFDSLASHQNIYYEQLFEEVPEATVLLDAGKTEKILNNLLSNAIKHTPSGGIVSIIARLENKRLVIQVKDTGSGIDSKDLPFIFDRFYQSSQPDAPMQGGTGIGLALAKELALFIDGSITAESILGAGTVFTVNLPYRVIEKSTTTYVEEVVEDLTESITIELSSNTKDYKVLIVEDHPDMQSYINSLVANDFTTVMAPNGKVALEILKNEEVDLIISDVMMPEMDGYALLQYLKDSEKYHHIPVIMLTALGDESHKLKALTVGVDDYLTKPFSPKELQVRVHNLLQHYEMRLRWKEEENDKPEDTEALVEEQKYNDVSGFLSHRMENEWLKKVEAQIASNLENEEFRLTDLAENFNLSYRQFLRRIKKLTGLSLKQYQQEIALQQARELLEKGKYGNASAVAYSVGMNNVTRFSKLYAARFGKKPASYFATFSKLQDI